MKKNLTDKTILVTGGSSRLGQAIAQKALQEGARVFVTYHRHPEKVKPLTENGAEAFSLDLTDMKAVEQFSKKIREKTKTLDVLIHNAAAVKDHTISNMTEEEWDLVLTADLKAPYYLTKKLLPLLFKGKQSRIFFMTSRAAIKGSFGASNYAAAKAGLIGLTKSLAQELGRKKIAVNAINPGFMKSSMTENLPNEVIQSHMNLSPYGDYSSPEAVADFILYLSSGETQQVTGQVIHYESRNL